MTASRSRKHVIPPPPAASPAKIKTANRWRLPCVLVFAALFAATRGGAGTIDPAAVRIAAQAAGIQPLRNVPIPNGATNLSDFLVNTPQARAAAIQLGTLRN